MPKFLLYIALFLSFILCVEFASIAYRNKYSVSLLEFFKKAFMRKSFNAGDYTLLSALFLVSSIFLLKTDILSHLSSFKETINDPEIAKELEASSISQSAVEESSVLFARPKLYENEIFGSTINKILVNGIFHAGQEEDIDLSVSHGIILNDPESSNGKARFIGESSIGDLLFYQTPEHKYNQFSGKYEVRARIKVQKKEGQLLKNDQIFEISVIDPTRKARIKQQSFSFSDIDSIGDYEYFSLFFDRESIGGASLIQVFSSGKAGIWLDTLEIIGRDVDKNVDLIEDVFPDVNDENASEGSTRLADPEKHLEGTMMFGPYDKSLNDGNYNVIFSIKTDINNIDIPIVRIETANIDEEADSQVIESYDIKASDFSYTGVYQSFSLPVKKTNSGLLEYRVYFYDVAKVWVDTVKIIPIKSSKDLKKNKNSFDTYSSDLEGEKAVKESLFIDEVFDEPSQFIENNIEKEAIILEKNDENSFKKDVLDINDQIIQLQENLNKLIDENKNKK